ncbi:MAG TPA: hypothetical protein VFE35_05045 [Candidatus Cybelea sp.]|jgi:hypothetical protein|nr:hypothetical protein [Candidatus Cybelea sp.]
MIDATQWVQNARATILTAVDSARSWDELIQQLDRDGVVVKLIARGTRVQGLAFAQGRGPGAPGCGASRIHPHCKKAALEQRFGACPFTPEQPPRRRRSELRDRAEREANTDPRWALRDAQRIVDHARMRSEYAQYRDRFFADRHLASGERREVAWERESVQRRCEAKRRREARRLLRAVARLAARGAVARQLAYWSIDTMMNRRRAHEYDAGRVRWEATKIVLASERRRAREEKPLAYRSFVTERARAGDLGAQRVVDALVAPARDRSEHVAQRDLRLVRLAEIRLRLNIIRAEEDGRYQRARLERQHLQHVERRPTLDEALAAERRRIHERAAEATRYTDVERVRLAQLAREKRSWNPLARRAAAKEEERLCGELRSRYEKALPDATREFEQHDLPQLEKQLAGHQRAYRHYVDASLGLEREMNNARAARDEVPRIERRLNVLERAGVARIDCDLAMGAARLDDLAAVIEQQYRALPNEIRRDVEYSIRKEQRARDSMTIDR